MPGRPRFKAGFCCVLHWSQGQRVTFVNARLNITVSYHPYLTRARLCTAYRVPAGVSRGSVCGGGGGRRQTQPVSAAAALPAAPAAETSHVPKGIGVNDDVVLVSASDARLSCFGVTQDPNETFLGGTSWV